MYAKYTVFLKDLIDNPDTKVKLDKAMSSYPLYQKRSKEEFIPAYIPTREELNKKILNFYKYREIGFETVGRFLDELEISLNEIMPYYNQLFYTIDQDYNPLYNVDYDREETTQKDGTQDVSTDTKTIGSQSTTGESGNTGTSKTTGNDSSSATDTVNNYNKSTESSTPQSQLTIVNEDIDTIDYADKVLFSHETNNTQHTSTGETETNTTSSGSTTNSQEVDSTTTGEMSGKTENSETETHRERVFGNYGQMSYQYLLEKYRDLIINVEQRIIHDERISELFMRVW